MFLYFTRILNKREFTEEKTGVFLLQNERE